MASLSQSIRTQIAPQKMLLHPFYEAWQAGELTLPQLQVYATQYYHHVNAFPRYISSIHSLCEHTESRRKLFENLADEEQGEDNHPALWLRFAAALGCEEEAVENASTSEATRDLIATFFRQTRTSYEKGLAALYTYEHQIPAVAETKIAGLKSFYGIDSYAGIQYFDVHQGMDVEHAGELEGMLDQLPEAKQTEALEASQEVAGALWNFLSQFIAPADNLSAPSTTTCANA